MSGADHIRGINEWCRIARVGAPTNQRLCLHLTATRHETKKTLYRPGFTRKEEVLT